MLFPLYELQLPTQPPGLPAMALTSKAKGGTGSWILPLREAKHTVELQGNSGQKLLPLDTGNLSVTHHCLEPPCNICCSWELQSQVGDLRTKLLLFLGGTSIKTKTLQPGRVTADEAGSPLPLRAILAAVNLTTVVLK